MQINIHEYNDKVQACWRGKNIGGTLGKPFEWVRKINDVTFYTEDLNEGPKPSTDIDIQLLWLRALEDHGVHIGTPVLSEYFLSYLSAYIGEYGPTKASMRAGLMPPLCSMSSGYRDSTSAFTRSEIWACIAPGCPEIAARNAYQDAIIDHGNGEGLYAAMFMAVVQSAAFIEPDMYKLIDIGLSYIPLGCGVYDAVECAIECYRMGLSWLEARDRVLEEHRGHYATWDGAGISERDWEKELANGAHGYDAPSNIGMIMIGWLYGEGDFARSICKAVNCGEDTDSNAATLGALLGIIGGKQIIPKEWTKPIGDRITTHIIDTYDVKRIPTSIKELAARVERLAKIIMLTYRTDVNLSETEPTSVSKKELKKLANVPMGEKILRNPRGPIYESNIITCAIDYKNGAYIRPGGTTRVIIKVSCKLKHELVLNVKWYKPDDFTIKPTASGLIRCPAAGVESSPYMFEIIADGPVALVNRFVIEITSPGRHTVALVPVVLLDGGLMSLTNLAL